MVTLIVTLLILALLLGVALGFLARGDDREKLIVAEKEVADLRSALAESRFQCIQQRLEHERRVESAHETIGEYEAILDQSEKRKQPMLSAVVLPFKNP